MANDNSITFSVRLDAKEAESELSRIKKKILEMEATLSNQQSRKTALEEEMLRIAAAAVEAHEKLEALRRDGASAEEIGAQRTIVAGLDQEFAAAEAAVEKQNAAIDRTNGKLEDLRTHYGVVEQQAMSAGKAQEESSNSSGSAIDALSNKLDHFTNRIAGLVKRVLFFSLITRALRSFREYLGNALQTSDEFNAAMARLKGAALTAFQPILTVAIPIITALINVLTTAMSMIASFTSMLFRTTAEASAESAENLYDEANALKMVGGGAAKAAKQLANFDEINQLSGSGGGGGGGVNKLNSPDFLGGIKGQMDELEIYLSGALLALGAVLTFTGASIPLGLGLMAVGALGLASALSENWDTMPDNIRNALTNTLLILGAGAFVIGAILTFSGANLPLGIGLMIAGAAALGTAAALNWDNVRDKLRGKLGAVVAVASTYLLGIGLLFTLSGAAIPLGVGLMIAGAAGLAAAASINWDTVKNFIKENLDEILAIGGAALLGLGLILALSGAALPLGIALIAAGAAALITEAALNWDDLRTRLQGEVGKIVAIASAGLLVLGLILSFTGVALPLGIALIAVGAAGLATEASLNWNTIKEKLSGAFEAIKNIGKTMKLALGLSLIFSGVDPDRGFGLAVEGGADLAPVMRENWDFILEKLQGIWDDITVWFGDEVAPVFTVAYWTDKFSTIGEGMKAGVNGALGAAEYGINWVIEKLNSLSFDVPSWVPVAGGKHFGLNISTISVPRLAAGAVIPPNREFLAVLGDQTSGTNIEAPLETIVAAFRQTLNESGAANRTLVLKIGEAEFASVVFDAFNSESARVGFSSVT